MTIHRVANTASPEMEQWRNEVTAATFVQAWECTRAGHTGMFVYTPRIAVDKFGDGFDIGVCTIIRFDDGNRQYHRGAIASELCEHFAGHVTA